MTSKLSLLMDYIKLSTTYYKVVIREFVLSDFSRTLF